MAYVDGFVVPVYKDKIEEYRKWAELAGKVWREYGALEYREWIADDVPPGKVTSFPDSVKLQPNEIVVFSWVVYESREKRDQVVAKVMADPRMSPDQMKPENAPFDMKRMIFGGFKPLVSL